MNAPFPKPIEPWPVSILPDNSNGVLMSDGSLRFFRSYGRAESFIATHPAPTAREQVEASIRADYHAEEMEAEYGPLARDPDFDERFESLEDADPYTDDRSEEIE